MTQTAPQSWRVTDASIRIICPLTVGGSFEATTRALNGRVSTTAARTELDGELVVDLRTLDTGIALRNGYLRDNYLEVHRPGYELAVLSQIRAGMAAAVADGGQSRFSGRLMLHGAVREVSGRALLRTHGDHVRVEVTFPLRLNEFGIANPRYQGVGVRNELTVLVTFTAVAADLP